MFSLQLCSDTPPLQLRFWFFRDFSFHSVCIFSPSAAGAIFFFYILACADRFFLHKSKDLAELRTKTMLFTPFRFKTRYKNRSRNFRRLRVPLEKYVFSGIFPYIFCRNFNIFDFFDFLKSFEYFYFVNRLSSASYVD